MRTDEFNYDLPDGLIAQEPARERDRARMLVVHRASGRLEHRQVSDLPGYLAAPDLLVVNDTRVIPARLLGVKEGTGGQVELLLIEEVAPHEWEVLLRCARRPRIGARMFFGGGQVRAELLAEGERGRARVRFESEHPLLEQLETIGVPPLPPYIRRGPSTDALAAHDRDRYQTVYAREPGAVAAPTAGLHFTHTLLKRLEDNGVAHATVTLHVGLGTFRPVTADEVEAHKMESERYQVPRETAARCRSAREKGGRVVAVGSTTVRTLETSWKEHGDWAPAEGRSSLYIYPPYHFHAVDAMITNFHLPKSTLLMMVCAFGGRDLVMAAYRTAVREKYRFYSYGDCMLLL